MNESDYEYRGLMAETWDLLRGDTSYWTDRFFFRDFVREGQPALDVGCGTGRLLLDYLSEELDVDGVDNSPEMLALCRRKAEKMGLQPRLYLQTMETLDLPRRYRTITVPSSSFQLVIVPALARQAMQRLYDHLLPGGRLVMPFMISHPPEASGDVYIEDWALTGEAVRPEDGALVRRWSRVTYDLLNQLEHTEDRYEVFQGDKLIASEHHRRSPAVRWYTQAQAVCLYEEAGFADIRVYKELAREPASSEDRLFSVVGSSRNQSH